MGGSEDGKSLKQSETKAQTQVENKDAVEKVDGEELRFSPEEEAALLEESTAAKTEANALFTSKEYQNALDKTPSKPPQTPSTASPN
ncbi:hypothetical protein G7046_g4888 [Stylonectria norvegica]|nr:hypothetical protein G7046_g4888 [Stylonectria norvegica]